MRRNEDGDGQTKQVFMAAVDLAGDTVFGDHTGSFCCVCSADVESLDLMNRIRGQLRLFEKVRGEDSVRLRTPACPGEGGTKAQPPAQSCMGSDLGPSAQGL